mmetsp:Transcript_22150/g.43100  ORF Transcript_22150/g.43100 Transcript_22150/m.43100 type:complete len:132 (-) Transcript_22150:106-501(-)
MANKLFERKKNKYKIMTDKGESKEEQDKATERAQKEEVKQQPRGGDENKKLLIARVIVKMAKILKSVLPSRMMVPVSPSSSTAQGEGRAPDKAINMPPKNATVLHKLRTVASVRRLCEIVFFPMNGSLHAM